MKGESHWKLLSQGLLKTFTKFFYRDCLVGTMTSSKTTLSDINLMDTRIYIASKTNYIISFIFQLPIIINSINSLHVNKTSFIILTLIVSHFIIHPN